MTTQDDKLSLQSQRPTGSPRVIEPICIAQRIERRFTLCTGKGGVGKSTVAALLALRFARHGKRTLLCELNQHQERLAPLLGHAPVGSKISEITENLWCVNIEPRAAMEEYALLKLRFKSITRRIFEHAGVQALINLMPGLNDLVMLGKAFNHERETAKNHPVWDRVVIDAPATGHGVPFFRLPQTICEAVHSGNLYKEAQAMQQHLADPARTAVHMVTLPETLPISETMELHTRLKTETNLSLGCLFVNRCLPHPTVTLQNCSDLQKTLPPNLEPWRQHLLEKQRQFEHSEQLISALQNLDMPLIRLPEIANSNRLSLLESLLPAFEEALQ